MKSKQTNNFHNIIAAIMLAVIFIALPLLEKQHFIFSQFLAQVILLIFMLYLFIRAVKTKQKITLSFGLLEFGFVLLLAPFLISAIASENKYQAFLILLDVIIFISFLIVYKNISVNNGQWVYYFPVVAGGFILSIIAILERISFSIHAGFLNDNLAALFIFISLLYALLYLGKLQLRSLKGIVLFVIILFMTTAEILFSSRSIYVILAVIFLVLMVSVKNARFKKILVIALIAGFIIALLGLYYKFSRIPYKWERIQIWETSLAMMKDNFLMGTGPGNFHLVAYQYNFPTFQSPALFALYPNHAHSQWLHIICETGILAVPVMVFLLIQFTLSTTYLYRTKSLATIAYMAIISFLIFGCFNNFFDSYALTFLFISVLVSFQKTVPGKNIEFAFSLTRSAILMVIVLITITMFLYVTIPYLAHINYQQSLSFYEQGKLIEAHSSINAAINKIPVNSSYFRLKAKIQFSLYQKNKNLELLPLIVQQYEKAKHINRSDFQVFRDEADFYLQLFSAIPSVEFIYNAINNYQSALNLNPHNPFYHYHLSSCYAILNNRDKAIEELKIAIDKEPNFIAGHFELSKLYNFRGNQRLSELHMVKAKELADKYRYYPRGNNEYVNNLIHIPEELLLANSLSAP